MFQANHHFASPSYGNPVLPDPNITSTPSERPANDANAEQHVAEQDFAQSPTASVVDTASTGGASNALPATALLNKPGILEKALAEQNTDGVRRPLNERMPHFNDLSDSHQLQDGTSHQSATTGSGAVRRPPMPQSQRYARTAPYPSGASLTVCLGSSSDGTAAYRTKPTLTDKIAG
jgi:hypothetical protein